MTLLEPFGVDYLRPAQDACPNCPCCSAALCRRGRRDVLECSGHTDPVARSTVAGCPCSAATTEGTAAWREALTIATLQAAELPLPEPVEDVLRSLAGGQTTVPDPHGLLLALRLRGFVQTRGDLLAVTDAGRAYLAARDGARIAVRGRVLDVDAEENTARVALDVDRPDARVTVLLDQLSALTGVEAYELPGLELDAVANLDAERAEEIVLTGIRARPAPLPDRWRKTAAPDGPDGEEAAGD